MQLQISAQLFRRSKPDFRTRSPQDCAEGTCCALQGANFERLQLVHGAKFSLTVLRSPVKILRKLWDLQPHLCIWQAADTADHWHGIQRPGNFISCNKLVLSLQIDSRGGVVSNSDQLSSDRMHSCDCCHT